MFFSRSFEPVKYDNKKDVESFYNYLETEIE